MCLRASSPNNIHYCCIEQKKQLDDTYLDDFQFMVRQINYKRWLINNDTNKSADNWILFNDEEYPGNLF